MKKLSIALVLFAVSTLAQATAVCTGAAGPGTVVGDGTAGTDFILKGFTPRCSTNVNMDFAQSARAVGVGSASSKGSAVFQGNSEGGAVRGTDCTNKRCAGTEAAGAATTALAAAASS